MKATAAATCMSSFCFGFRPSDCFFTIFRKSSMKPIRPNSRVSSSTGTMRTSRETTRKMIPHTRIASRKPMPPIVGVPAFFRCAWGPSSRICCPNLSLCRNGMSAAVATALIASASTISRIYFPISPFDIGLLSYWSSTAGPSSFSALTSCESICE